MRVVRGESRISSPDFSELWLCQGERIGDVGQLGERLNGIQEVGGAIPCVSTIKNPIRFRMGFLFWVEWIDYSLITLAACNPLAPSVISNSTVWPSVRDL